MHLSQLVLQGGDGVPEVRLGDPAGCTTHDVSSERDEREYVPVFPRIGLILVGHLLLLGRLPDHPQHEQS